MIFMFQDFFNCISILEFSKMFTQSLLKIFTRISSSFIASPTLISDTEFFPFDLILTPFSLSITFCHLLVFLNCHKEFDRIPKKFITLLIIFCGFLKIKFLSLFLFQEFHLFFNFYKLRSFP